LVGQSEDKINGHLFSDMHCIRNDHQSVTDSVAPLVDKKDILDGLLVELMLDEHSSTILVV